MRKIFGLETEYRDVSKFLFNDNRNNILRSKIEQIPNHNHFLENGARLYFDQRVVEYSTPECLSIFDLLAHEKAGDLIVFSAFKDTFIEFYKSSSNLEGNKTTGCHENYLVKRKLFYEISPTGEKGLFSYFLKAIVPFLVSRIILIGSGMIYNNEYIISQRALFISDVVGSHTTSNRALVNLKDEPLVKQKSEFSRLHLICGDVNLSEISNLLKLGTTAIVLELIEEKFLENIPKLHDPLSALNIINRDPTCKVLVSLDNGEYINAVEIQEYYLSKCFDYFAKVRKPDQEEELVLKIWSQILEKLKRNVDECDTELDWVIKKKLIETYQRKKNLSSTVYPQELKVFTFFYHLLNPNKSLYQKLLKKGMIKRLINDKMVEIATKVAPQNTRAKLRSEVIKALFKNKKYYEKQKNRITIDWDKISYEVYHQIYKTIVLEPFQTEDKEVDKFIEIIRKY